MSEAPRFELPIIQDNPTGWGPSSLFENFKDVPYQPFSKGDRLGRASDWAYTNPNDRRQKEKYAQYGAGGTAFSYYHDEDESSFSLVDTSKQTTRKFVTKRFNQNSYRNAGGRGGGNAGGYSNTNTNPGNRRYNNAGGNNSRGRYNTRGYNNRYRNNAQQNRSSSVEVKPSWQLIEELDFNKISKYVIDVAEPEELMQCGAVDTYDIMYDKIAPKLEKPLQTANKAIHNPTASADPIINQLAEEGQGNIFSTESVLSALMACTKAIQSFDIVVNKANGKIFLDKRDSSSIDEQTVNETAPEPPIDEGEGSINGPGMLSMEATFINQHLSQQLIKKPEYTFPQSNPFAHPDDDVRSVGYRYRKWKVGSNTVVARTEVDAYLRKTPAAEPEFIAIKAFNEFNPRLTNWRKKLEAQRGAVLADEFKNNGFRVARLAAATMLSGVSHIKLGYVSRQNPMSATSHVILGTQTVKPKEIAQQINFSQANAWGLVAYTLAILNKLEDGKYVLLKDPNKPVMALYSVPMDSFEEKIEEADSEDEDEGV